MIERIRSRLTYANVVASIAVFLALGGGAFALTLPKNSVGPRQIKKNGVRGPDVLESSLGKVPNAAHADTATSATDATHADSATNADNASHADAAASADTATSADNAANAANADKLDNLDSTDIGLGFFTGRVKDLQSTGTTGSPPSGLSTATTQAAVTDQDLTLSPGRSIVMRDLSVSLTQAVACGGICGSGENVTVALQALSGTTVSTSISCNILTTFSSCAATGPSGTVTANSPLRLAISKSGDAQIPAGTDALFSWRATAP